VTRNIARSLCDSWTFCSASGRSTSSFSIPNHMAIFWRDPLTGVEYRWGRQKWRFSTNICFSIDDWWSVINNFDRGVIYSTINVDVRLSRRPPRISESCLWQQASTTTPKRIKQNFILCIGKSETEVKNNNKRLQSRHCTAEATERHEASRGLSPTAELLVLTRLYTNNCRLAS